MTITVLLAQRYVRSNRTITPQSAARILADGKLTEICVCFIFFRFLRKVCFAANENMIFAQQYSFVFF